MAFADVPERCLTSFSDDLEQDIDPQENEDRGEKHTLTPSKAQREPKPKWLRAAPDDTETKVHDEKQVTQVAEGIASLSVKKPSNKFYQDRHVRFENLLKENLIESKGSEVSQEDILDLLELQSNSSDKRIATKAVTDTFPSAKYSKRKLVYQNVSKLVSFTQSERGITVLEENSNVSKLKEKLKLSSELISSWQNDIRQLYDQQPLEVHQLRVTCLMYDSEVEKHMNLHAELDKLYETEIECLMMKTHGQYLPQSVRDQFNDEFSFLCQRVNLGLRDPEKQIEFLLADQNLDSLRSDFEKKCPLLWDVMRTLFPVDAEGHTRRKELSFTHAISVLMSLKDKDLRNDIKLCFSVLLLSYGVGCRLMNFLCKMSLTYNWETNGRYLDSYIENKLQYIKNDAPPEVPIILLIDNINMYRGNKKYHRLFKTFGPKMWNFTGRGVLIPNTDGLSDLFDNEETAAKSQKDLNDITFDDISLQLSHEHSELWNEWKEHYILDCLFDGLNAFPKTMNMHDLDEKSFNEWLKTYEEDSSFANYKIERTSAKSVLKVNDSSQFKSNVHVLPLSIENNSTVAGSGAIIHEFGNMFGLPQVDTNKYLPYDVSTKSFSLKQARAHFVFKRILHDHQHEMAEYEKQLTDTEKRLDAANEALNQIETEPEVEYAELLAGISFNNFEDEDLLEGVEPLQDDDLPDNVVDFAAMEEDSAIPSSTLQSKKKKFQKEDRQFLQMYNKLQTKMWKFHDENNLDSFIQYLSDKQEILNECRDHFGRTLLHFSVEHDNLLFAQCILSAGFNPNVVEYCGATPLTLAVCLNLPWFCELLVKCGCEVRGPVFVGIPSPLEMARKLENAQIYGILNPDESDSEDADLRSYEKKFSNKDQANTCTEREHHKDHGICRSTAGFLTGIVGDAGTCKVNRSVMERPSAYSWIGIIPGDLHTKGAMIESCFKKQCAGGFHHPVKNVLKRPKLKTEVFKDKKFEEDNYRKIREAVRDCAKSYCMAAVQEFRVSNSFPDPGTLRSCFRKYGNNNRAIVDTFLNWININNERNVSFRYHSRMFMHYGPMMELFDYSTHYNSGIGRETVYMLHLPSFSQLGFRNYYTEVFVHVINFTAKWPLAFCRLVSLNSCINLTGKDGKGIELDSWVESRIVKPTKKAVSGHATVKTCTRLGGSVDFVTKVKDAYKGELGFADHSTSRHSVASPLPDQLKGAWYCVRKGLFSNSGSEADIICLASNEKVPRLCIDVEQKGRQKIQENFKKKLYDSFSDVRFTTVLDNTA